MCSTTTSRRSFLAVSLATPGLFGQDADVRFRTTVPLVVAPVTVQDRSGRPIDGLTGSDFDLLDNGVRRPFNADITIHPIALVVAIQTNANATAALSKIRLVGPMIEPLLTGERGCAALVAFGDEVRVARPFERDPAALTASMRSLVARGDRSRLIDAVDRAIRLFQEGPQNHRRVLLLISEMRDRSSESKLEEVATLAQRENVSIYTLTYSPFLSQFAVKQHEARPAGGLNLLAIFTELAQASKENAADALSRYTGGRRLSFLRQKALEQAITAIGEELHSQYLLSFTPPAEDMRDFHRIEVRVKGRPDALVRTRPGYWLSLPGTAASSAR